MAEMITFILSVVALVVGYLVYGKLADRVFGSDEKRPVPAKTLADGLDYVAM
ncbi:MAG: carbon starvation CstA family protein, partial [Eubacteriales bacterium]